MTPRDYTPRERAIIALERRPPVPGLVPTFELEFQLTQEMMGKEFHRGWEVWSPAGATQRVQMIAADADLYVRLLNGWTTLLS